RAAILQTRGAPARPRHRPMATARPPTSRPLRGDRPRRRHRGQLRARTQAGAERRARPALVRDQPLARELGRGLVEADVGRRQDHVRPDQLVVVDRPARALHELEQLAPDLAELRLVPCLHCGDGRVVELVESVGLVVWELVLTVRRDPDDHWAGSCLPCSRAGDSAGAGAGPSSAFIFASSSSTCAPEESCESSLSMSSSPPSPSAVMSSNAPAASSSCTASALARMPSTLSWARCIASPRSAICSPTPFAASEIRTWASDAEYCALMTSFLVRKVSIFACIFFSLSVSCSCWRLSSVTCWSSVCCSFWASVFCLSAVRVCSS